MDTFAMIGCFVMDIFFFWSTDISGRADWYNFLILVISFFWVVWQSYNENNDSEKKKKMLPKTYRWIHTKFISVFVSLSFPEKCTSKLRKLRVLSPFSWMQENNNKVNLVQSWILLSLNCLLVQKIMGLWIWNLKQERVGENIMSIFVNVSAHRLV